jgi:hypothetical protein
MPVETERLGRVLVITMRREHKRNAIDASITAGLDAALNDLEDDPGLCCGVFRTGTAADWRRSTAADHWRTATPAHPAHLTTHQELVSLRWLYKL